MNNEFFLGLVYNASLLLAMVLIFDLLTTKLKQKTSILWQILAGFILGGVGLAVMLTNWQLLPGVVFDTRSVLLSVTGLFFGWIPTLLAMLITGSYRFLQSGSGVTMGVSVILMSGLVGLIWRSFRKNTLQELSWLEIYVFGLIVHGGMMTCTMLLPSDIRTSVQTSIWFPVMTIYPFATLLLGLLMSNMLRRDVISEQLAASEEKYRTLIEQSTDGVLIIDRDGRLLLTNTKWRNVFGYTEEESSKLRLEDTYLPGEKAKAEDRLARVILGEELHFTRKAVTKSGRVLAVEIDAKKISDDKIQEFMRDISERERKESELRESEEKFAQVFRNGPEIITISTLKEAIFLDVNEAFTKEIGFKKEEVLGRSADDLNFWINEDQRRRMVKELRRKKTLRNREYVFRRKNGELITCLCSMTTIKLEGKDCLLILAVNIEDRKKIEKELKQVNMQVVAEKQNFESILKEMGDAVVVTDAEKKVILVNKAALGMCGKCAKKLMKNDLEATINWKYETSSEKPDDLFKSVFKEKKTMRAKETIVLTNLEDQSILLDVVATPILKDGGDLVGSVWIMRDVTKEKELDRLRGDFISLASHQLRTPLTGIKWFVELLSEDVEKIPVERIREYVLKIGESSNRMIDLVNDLLTTSRADGGRLVREISSYTVKDLLTQAIEGQGRLFVEKKIGVVGIEKISESLRVEVDRIQILQVLGNLLNNAANYSSSGSKIEVGAETKGKVVTIRITDYGRGIPIKQQKKIFEKFFRADNVAKTIPGSGLGLYVAKSMIESHGGKIWFTSKENEGTTFFVELPMKQNSEVKEADRVNDK